MKKLFLAICLSMVLLINGAPLASVEAMSVNQAASQHFHTLWTSGGGTDGSGAGRYHCANGQHTYRLLQKIFVDVGNGKTKIKYKYGCEKCSTVIILDNML